MASRISCILVGCRYLQFEQDAPEIGWANLPVQASFERPVFEVELEAINLLLMCERPIDFTCKEAWSGNIFGASPSSLFMAVSRLQNFS